MKTGSYIYTDGTRSEELDQSKTIAGILCNVTDTHGYVRPVLAL